MRAAMLRGAPDPTQILFKVRILPVTTTPDNALAPGNAANPNTKLSHGPYRRYQLDLAADPRAILFTRSADGRLRGNLQICIYTYDADGNVIVENVTATHASLTAADVTRLRNGGIQLHEQISVPVKGAYFLRVGVHDLASDRIGAVEVPVAAVRNLPPLSLDSPAAARPATP
jgi:hypothetical protein